MKRYENTRKRMKEKQGKISANTFGCTKVKWSVSWSLLVWVECSSQGGFMHPYSHTFGLAKWGRNTVEEEEPSSNSRHEVYTQATRVLPSMRSHLQQTQLPEGISLRIIDQIQWSWACSKALDVYFPRNAHFLHLDQPIKRYGPKIRDCPKLDCISVLYFVGWSWPIKWSPN